MTLRKYLLTLSLLAGSSGLLLALPQQDTQGAKQDAPQAGQDTTKSAGQEAGADTKKKDKKAAHTKKSHKSKKDADKADKTQTPPPQ